MKAAVVTGYGPPEVVELREMPMPQPGDRERERAVFMPGAARPVQADRELLKKLADGGELRSVIGRTYAFADLVEAHRHADTGHKIGNLVVVMDASENPPA